MLAKKSKEPTIEDKKIAALKKEVEKYFGDESAYINRRFINRNPARDTLISNINQLFTEPKNTSIDILTKMQEFGKQAQLNHVETSGSRFFGCGPLIHKTCGFRRNIDRIVENFNRIFNEETSLLINSKQYEK